MSEVGELQKDVRYLREQWDKFMKEGGPKCAAHDEAVVEVYKMKEKFIWLSGVVAAVVFFMPILYLVIVSKTEREVLAGAVTAKTIVAEVLAKMSAGG